MNPLVLLLGISLVGATGADMVSTLVTTQRRTGRYWPTQVFYRRGWLAWAWGARRMRDAERRRRYLAAFGPLSLLLLLLVWVVLLLVGWGIIWWAVRDRMEGIGSFSDAVYYAGVGFLTVGFGDILPEGTTVRMLTLAEALMGIGTTALVIGYLPTLYAAYSRRETQLLMLDDLAGDSVTPASFIESYCPDGDLTRLYSAFGHWERWCADVFDSHTAYPMLGFFRSRLAGQSWLTAIALVSDAASITMATVPGSFAHEPLRLYRRSTLLLGTLASAMPRRRHHVSPEHEAAFRATYDRLGAIGLSLRPFDEAWTDLVALRSLYEPHVAALTDSLLVGQEFRSRAPELPVAVQRSAAADGVPDLDEPRRQSPEPTSS